MGGDGSPELKAGAGPDLEPDATGQDSTPRSELIVREFVADGEKAKTESFVEEHLDGAGRRDVDAR